MRISAIKKQFIREGGILAGIIGVLVAIFLYVSGEKEGLEKQLSGIKNESNRIVQATSNAENRNQLIVESLEIYKTLPRQRLPSTNLHLAPQRVRDIRPILDSLKSRYKLSMKDTNLSPIEDATKELKTEHVLVYRNQITISFEALTDELAMSFCYALIRELPGYATISNVGLKRIGAITPEVISSIQAREDELPYLVEGTVVFNWWTLRAKPEEKEQNT